MANRFVSGGTIGSSGEVSKDAAPGAGIREGSGTNNKEWEAVQQELEAERKRREEQRVKAATGQEQSLYDVLQANKAAKQAAFEEQTKVRNQFRALDDDEIDFLDGVRESKRKEEEAARREVEEGLRAFRERQQKTGDAGEEEGGEEKQEEEAWGVGRKRKRAKDRERDIKGVRRRVSDAEKSKKDEGKQVEVVAEASETEQKTEPKKEEALGKKSLGLVSYGSDDDTD